MDHKDKIGFLKIDAELAELRILQGIDEKDFDKIDQICIEIHSEKLLNECSKILKDKFLHVWHNNNAEIPNHFMLYGTKFKIEGMSENDNEGVSLSPGAARRNR